MIKANSDSERLREEKTKIGSWLNCLSAIRFPNLSMEEKNQMEWEKIILFLFWNARVKKLNTVFPPSPLMKPLSLSDSKSKNILRDALNKDIVIENELLKKILTECLNYEAFDLKVMIKKIYATKEIRTTTPPLILAFISTFQIIPDFEFLNNR